MTARKAVLAPRGRRCNRPGSRVGRRRLGRRRHVARPNAANDADESAGHEPERHARLGSVHGQIGSFSYSVNMNGLSFTVPQTQTTYTITSLSAGQTYSFYVTAVDKALNTSGRSNIVTATTPSDTTPPTTPQLSGTVRSPSQVSLTWTRSTDDLAWFVGYRICANGALVTEHVNWYAETRVVLRHLRPATSYTFTVQAHDFSGTRRRATRSH
jgi:Fibronectin type III domain